MLGRAPKPQTRLLCFFLLAIIEHCRCELNINTGAVAFVWQDRRFAVHFEAATFSEAVSACSNNTLLGDDVVGALLPASVFGSLIVDIAADQPQTAQALQSALAGTAAANGSEAQRQWELWLWDEFRVCRAAKLLPGGSFSSSGGSGAGPDLTLVTTDRPCSWRLAYVCAEEQAVVLAAGLSSSSAWYRRHFAPGAPEPLLPSPYAATGPVATSSGSSSKSGLKLYRSGFVAGGPLGKVFWPDLPVPDYSGGPPRVVQPFPVTIEVEDGAERFWRLGPVVTALYRGGNRRLTALRLVREGEAADAWAAYQGQSPAVGLPPPFGDGFVLGVRSPDFDAGPGYETYNVGPYNDYIVAVEGCFRANEVEGLTLITRSGRRLQLGRGGCSHWFREDAPPGGYLAGAWSQFLNASAWDRYLSETRNLGHLDTWDMPWLHQLSFIWAAPAGLPPPSSTVRRPPVVDTQTQAPACLSALPMSGRVFDVTFDGCMEVYRGSRTCSSNTCCNRAMSAATVGEISGAKSFGRCGVSLAACQTECAPSSGLCGVIPEAAALHFLTDTRRQQLQTTNVSLPLTSYFVSKEGVMSYADAVQFCGRSSYMGLDWEMVRVQDALDWAASGWTRRGAHEALSTLGYVWVAPSPLLSDSAQPSEAAGASCTRVAFGLPDGLDSPSATDSHTLAVGDCALLAAVVCRAVARPLSASATAAATAAAALQATDAGAGAPATTTSSSLALVNVSSTYPLAAAVLGGASSLADRMLISPAAAAAAWVPGPHTLHMNTRRLGIGPYTSIDSDGKTAAENLVEKKRDCSFGIGTTTGTAVQTNSSGGTAATRGAVVTDLQQPVTAISVSIAVQLTNETDSVAVLSAVRLRLGSGGSWQQSMGLVSSGGWETFQLAPGEVLVAVSGCAGGFVERVVFHTNAGRRWTHALLGAAAACSVPFLESAPQPGGYLVGMQASVGHYVSSLQLVWGAPTSTGALSAGGTGSSSATGGRDAPAAPSGLPVAVDSGGTGNPESNTGGTTGNSTGLLAGPGAGGVKATGAIAGAAAGVAVTVALLVALVALLLVRRRQRMQHIGSGYSSEGPEAAAKEEAAGASTGAAVATAASGPAAAAAHGACKNAKKAVAVVTILTTADSTCDDTSQRSSIHISMCASSRAPRSHHFGKHSVPASLTRAHGTATRPSDVVITLRPHPALPLSCASQFQHTHSPSASSSLQGGGTFAGGTTDTLSTALNSQRVARCDFGGGSDAPSSAILGAPVSNSASGSYAALAQAAAAPHGSAARVATYTAGAGVARVVDTAALCMAAEAGIVSDLVAYSERVVGARPPPYWAGAAAAATATAAVGGAPQKCPAAMQDAATATVANVRTLAAIQPSDLESRLSAYIMRVDGSLWTQEATHHPPAAGGVPSKPTAARRRPPPIAAAAAAAAQAAAELGSLAGGVQAIHTVAEEGEEGEEGGAAAGSSRAAGSCGPTAAAAGPFLTAEQRNEIRTAITHMQAELASRQGGCWQGLHVQAVLGRGGFGVVYLGTWRNLRVAIKTLVVHDALAGGQARQRHRGIIEAAISKSLQHPNVVTTYETEVVPLAVVPAAVGVGHSTEGQPKRPAATAGDDSSDSDVYKLLIIQEYCNVGSLSAALDAGVFGSIAEGGTGLLCGLALALDIACGMRHIHSRNIIHGDLSAGNVLLSSSRAPESESHKGARAAVLASAAPPAPEAAASAPAAGAEGDAQLPRPLEGLWRLPVTAKLSDFGLSLPMGENQTHASNRFQGTPGYTAPEVLSRGRLSLAADVWSFGVLLLELCHGMRFKRIYAAQHAAAAAGGGAESPPGGAGPIPGAGAGTPDAAAAPWWASAVPPSCPPQLTALVRSCLSLSPAARPTFDQIAGSLVSLVVQANSAGQPHAAHGKHD